MQWMWLAVTIFAIVIEAVDAQLVSIWFVPGALAAMVMAFVGVPWWWQVVVFVALGFVLLLSLRPLCRKFIKPRKNETNVDALVGKQGLVTEQINNIAETGEVKVNGLRWSARAASDEIIEQGAIVTVLEVQGVKLIVRK